MFQTPAMRTRRRSIAPILLIVAMLLSPFANASAVTTVVRVLFRDGPVPGAPVEIIDVRSGVTVATADADARGCVTFDGLQEHALYEAQTPNGKFVTGAFEAGAPVKLHVRDAQGSLFGFALSAAAVTGGVSGDVSLLSSDISYTESESKGKGAFVGPAIRGRIFGPELGPLSLTLFLEGGVEPANSFDKEPFSKLVDQTNNDGLVESIVWERGLAWNIGVGIAAPLPLRSIRAWGEFELGFHRERLSFKLVGGEFGVGTFTPSNSSVDDIDSLAVGVQLPVELWRRGFSSVLLELGIGARIPIGGSMEVLSPYDPNSPLDDRLYSFKPKATVAAHVGIRVQFGYSRLPSLR